jgi:hypothetical protein
MIWLNDLAAYSLVALGAVMLALQFAALSIGHRIGRFNARRLPASDKDPTEGVGIVVGGLLGLLAFTLGLTISTATARFEDRRRTALDEANAIGTAWLRAEAIGHPRGHEIGRLLETYAQHRVAWLTAPRDSAVLARASAETSRLQTLMWGHAAAITRERPDPVVAGLQAALNETFDLATSQRWAFLGQIPNELPWLLLGLTFASMGGIGYQWGLKGRWHPMAATLLLLAWSGCLVLVADLSNPRVGWVRVDPAAYLWTIQGMQGGVPIPPAP